MPNSYSVYMHDTNHKEFFSADYRFQSSGCTRVEDPRGLAAWLLEDTPGWSRAQIDAGIAKGERMDVRLSRKVPVAWVYLTGWVTRDGGVHFRDDVYGHDDKPALVADARPKSRERCARLGLRATVRRIRRRCGRCPISTVSDRSLTLQEASMWKPALVLALIAATVLPTHANNSTAELSTGGLIFVHNPDVEMRSEDLFISAREVHVRYRFFNSSPRDVTVLVAFPMPDVHVDGPDENVSVPTEDPENFLAFATTVNGKPVATKVEQRVIAVGLDRTQLLRSLGVPLAPHLATTHEALDRLPADKWQDLLGTIPRQPSRTRTSSAWPAGTPARPSTSSSCARARSGARPRASSTRRRASLTQRSWADSWPGLWRPRAAAAPIMLHTWSTTGGLHGQNWTIWSNALNPDLTSPWNWNFNFPKGVGYYEFYSVGKVCWYCRGGTCEC